MRYSFLLKPDALIGLEFSNAGYLTNWEKVKKECTFEDDTAIAECSISVDYYGRKLRIVAENEISEHAITMIAKRIATKWRRTKVSRPRSSIELSEMEVSDCECSADEEWLRLYHSE